MPATSLRLRPSPRAGLALALIGALVLAEGLSASAGVSTAVQGVLRVSPLAPPSDGPGAAEAPGAARVSVPLPASTVPAERMRPLSVAAQAAAAAADLPPYAPGGDDILGGEPSDPVRPLGLRDEAPPVARPSSSGGVPFAVATGQMPALRSPGRAGAAAGLRLWLDHTVTADGLRLRLNAATAGAGACLLSGALQGRLAADGRRLLPALPPGRHAVGVACRIDGALVEQALTLAVPLPVLPGSQANRHAYAQGDVARAGLQQLGWVATGRVAAGDFFQEGRIALVGLDAGGTGLVQFQAVDDAGRWTDRTAERLPWTEDRRGCAAPREVLSADLNRDGVPDVFVVCAEAAPVLFLSQPGGHHRRVDGVGPPLPGGPVELLDADGDGLIDVVVPGAPGGVARLAWRGRGDGSFAAP